VKSKTILFFGVLAGVLFIFFLRTPTLEKELYWYQSEGFSIYRLEYRDFVNDLPPNRTLSENKISRGSLRGYVLLNNGIVYYDSELELLYCAEVAESGVWVYIYFTEIENWGKYWHDSTDSTRSSYFITDG